MPSYSEIIANFQAKQEAANLANEQRYAEALSIYDEIIGQYRPEGGFLTGAKAELEKQKGREVAGQTQSLVSSGLFGTSITAGLGQKWEAEVGQPARLKLEDIRMGRLAEALQSKAGLVERREDVGPDYASIAALSAQAASGGRGGTYQAPQYPGSGDIPPDPDWWGAESPFGGRTAAPSTPTQRTGVSDTSAQTQETKTPYSQTTAGMEAAARYSAQQQATGQEFPGSYIGAAGTAKQFDPQMGQLSYQDATRLGTMQPQPSTQTGTREPYIEGMNYASQYYRKTGKKLSQQAAYSALGSLG